MFFIIDIIYQINVYILGFFVYVDVYIYLIIKVHPLPLYKNVVGAASNSESSARTVMLALLYGLGDADDMNIDDYSN